MRKFPPFPGIASALSMAQWNNVPRYVARTRRVSKGNPVIGDKRPEKPLFVPADRATVVPIPEGEFPLRCCKGIGEIAFPGPTSGVSDAARLGVSMPPCLETLPQCLWNGLAYRLRVG